MLSPSFGVIPALCNRAHPILLPTTAARRLAPTCLHTSLFPTARAPLGRSLTPICFTCVTLGEKPDPHRSASSARPPRASPRRREQTPASVSGYEQAFPAGTRTTAMSGAIDPRLMPSGTDSNEHYAQPVVQHYASNLPPHSMSMSAQSGNYQQSHPYFTNPARTNSDHTPDHNEAHAHANQDVDYDSSGEGAQQRFVHCFLLAA